MSDDLYQRLKPLSPKARASIKADGWMTVWEGAIRSGKTVASLIAFLAYIERSKEKRFIMSGKTYTSLVRNAIDGDFGLLALGAPHLRLCKDRSGSDVVTYRDKKIYLVGAADSTSYMKIKGLTAGGWYADEVATHPESFIVEALARTAISSDRRIFWTLNPTVPTHYIYSQFLDTWEGMKGYRRYHFTLDDNLAMSKERKAELAAQYHGRYRMMYILGLRCAAEGAIYDSFTPSMVYKGRIPEDVSESQRFVACDYGTVNPCVFLECQMASSGIVYVSRELRWDSRKEMSQKTDQQYVDDMVAFIGSPDETDAQIIVDPSASSFITALRLQGYYVINGKNDVLSGIRRLSSLFAMNRVRIHESCTGLISELQMYIWDEKAAQNGEERPLKVNDHAPDALRYYVMTALNAYDLHLNEQEDL